MTDTLLIPFWSSCPTSHLRVLGLDFEDRIVLQCHKVGFKKILTRFGPNDLRELPEEFLMFNPNILLSDEAWKQVRSLQPGPDSLTIANQTNSCVVVRCGDTEFLSRAFEESESYLDLVNRLTTRLKREAITLGEADFVTFQSKEELRRVETWLLRGLIKESEGFMSRHVSARFRWR